MKRRALVTATLLLAAGITATAAIAAGPALPPAVQRAVTSIFGAAKVDVKREREGGVEVFEVRAPTHLEVVLDAQGSVTEVEVKIPVGLVPAPVLGAAKRALPKGARVVEAELLIRGERHLYELEARGAAGEIELVLDPRGEVLSQEVEADDDDDDKDDD